MFKSTVISEVYKVAESFKKNWIEGYTITLDHTEKNYILTFPE